MGSRVCRIGASGGPLDGRHLVGTEPAAEEPTPLAVLVRWRGTEALIAVHGEIDFATAGVLSAHLGQVTARRPGRLVIDLAGVGFMDCAGVSAVVRARRDLPAASPLVLRSAAPAVRKVISITGLDQTCLVEAGPPRQPARTRCPAGSRLSRWQPAPEQ